MTTASSTSYANAASVLVELQCRGAYNLDSDAQTSSMKVAGWLDTQDTSTLAGDLAAYTAEMDGEDATDASRRYAALLTAASRVAHRAATETWLVKDADLLINITIEPR